jgi:hypothetical protein
MRIGFLILAIGALWAVDVIANDSRYSSNVWREASHQGQQFQQSVHRWLKKAGF